MTTCPLFPSNAEGYSTVFQRSRHSRQILTLVQCALMAWFGLRESQAQSWPDEHSHGPFHYHADFQLGPLHPLLTSVSQLERDIPRTLGIGQCEEPVHVFLFSQKHTYETYVRKYFPTVPNRPALFVKQRGPGMVFAHLGPDIAVDLRHETTHAVLHGILPMVPLWLDEGLGEYFEMPSEVRSVKHPHLKSIKSHVRWGRVPKLESLERLSDLRQMKSQHYRNAWAWTHFALHGPPEAKEALLSFLRDIEAQVPPGRFSDRIRRRIPRIESAFLDHFRGRPLR